MFSSIAHHFPGLINILGNFQKIASKIRSLEVTPVFQTVPYVLNQPAINNRIDSLNVALKTMCQTEKINLIDLNRLLARQHNLNEELQRDGIHLNEKGYAVWAGALRNYLDIHGLK